MASLSVSLCIHSPQTCLEHEQTDAPDGGEHTQVLTESKKILLRLLGDIFHMATCHFIFNEQKSHDEGVPSVGNG